MFGWADSEIRGRSLRESILPPASGPVHEAFVRQIANSPTGPTAERRIELIVAHRDGREFPTEWSLAPLRVQGVPQWCAFVRDITERRRAEGEIRQLNAQLEQRVVERTAELARRVTEAEQLNQELQAFSYSVSHDLRAPLRNITGFLELLVKRSASRMDAEESRFVGTVTREAARMGELINDLLDFSKVGRTEMKLERVGLTDLVTEVRDSLQTEIGARAIEWQIGELPVLAGDRSLLRQVLANLLGNAVKFTRQRDPAFIEIGALPATNEEAGLVTIFVRDNGAGFNPKYQDRLFGVFQRLHSSRDFEGTGIGLANVKRIITRHGGRVWAEGSVDKGAVFYFTLTVSPT
jgi:PAS domain S-box-containing protein